MRKDNTSITKRALDRNPQGIRKRGGPRETWRKMKDKDLQRNGKSWNDIKKLTQDIEGWKVFVCGLYPGAGSVRQR